MKKLLIAVFIFLFFTQHVHASGPYDGIWELNTPEYALLSENGGRLIVTMIDKNSAIAGWGAGWGYRYGSSVRVEPLRYRGVYAVFDLFFTSLTSFEMRLISCAVLEPGYFCSGIPAIKYGNKVW